MFFLRKGLVPVGTGGITGADDPTAPNGQHQTGGTTMAAYCVDAKILHGSIAHRRS
jgi:hypothetical protein